jgi:hypothetical protein
MKYIFEVTVTSEKSAPSKELKNRLNYFSLGLPIS